MIQIPAVIICVCYLYARYGPTYVLPLAALYFTLLYLNSRRS